MPDIKVIGRTPHRWDQETTRYIKMNTTLAIDGVLLSWNPETEQFNTIKNFRTT